MIGSVVDSSNAQSLLVALVSVIGGGTIVPLVYAWWQRRKPEERRAAQSQDDERSTHAAREAVSAVRDVLVEMRHERKADKERIAQLEGENAVLRGRLPTV